LVDELYFYETPSTLGFNPNVWVDVTQTFEAKLQMLAEFKSQQHRDYMSVERVRGLAHYRASQIRRDGLYEAFHLARAVQ
jgi:LmbE family N-acetylglucosaminyl deacetylase